MGAVESSGSSCRRGSTAGGERGGGGLVVGVAAAMAVAVLVAVALRRPSGTEVRRMASKERRSAKGEGGGGDCVTWRERVSTARWQLLMAQGAAREARWNGRGQLWPWEHTQAKV